MDETNIKIYGPDEGTYQDGVKLGRRGTDYIAGGPGSLPYEVRNESGDWSAFLPSGERQSNRSGDSMSCVTFSALNSLETQHQFLTGKTANYSDRWTAKRSNTTPEGNFLWQVADTIRKEGLVPESLYPAPSSYTWMEYHADIPEPLSSQLLAEGKQWLTHWQISYEWIPISAESFAYHLRHAPIQVVFPSHAVLMYRFDSVQNLVYYFDSYSPYLKARKLSEFNSALKIILTGTIMTTNSVLVKRGNEYGFFDPATSEEGLISQMLNRGIKPPQDAQGKLIWAEVDKLVQGQVS